MENSDDDLGDGEANPLNFEWERADWVQSGRAIQETIEFYLASGAKDRETARENALSAIDHRISSNKMWANSPQWYLSIENFLTEGAKSDDEIIKIFPDYDLSNENCGLIPQCFWNNLFTADLQFKKTSSGRPPNVYDKLEDVYARLDWSAGDFEFNITIRNIAVGPVERMVARGAAFGVCFERNGLPATQPVMGGKVVRNTPMKPTRPALPRLSEAALNDWWKRLGDDQRESSHGALLELCRANFPDKSISRQRVRELSPHRKRGPKPISGKVPA